MTSPAEQAFWPEFLRRLADTPLATLVAEYDAVTVEIEAALAATTGDRPVQQEAWWPEVLRQHEAGSLRDLARRFGTNPRRLRRGLARAAVRVHGEAVAEEGLSRFEPVRERLGKEPDKTLAAEIGVTIEAIQGERRRLGIEPYRMRPDAEEWGEKVLPKREKPRPRRRWQDAPEPEIFRRAMGSAPAAAEPAPVAERPLPVITRTAFRRMGQTDEETDQAPEAARPASFRGFSPEGTSAEAAGGAVFARGLERPRRRIVRPNQTEPEEPPSPATLPRLSRPAAVGSVRVISPVEEAPITPEEETEAPPPRVRRVPTQRRTGRTVSPTPPPDPAPEGDPLDLDLPPEADTLSAAPGAVPVPTPAEVLGAYAWQVAVPGRRQPLLVVADDIALALQIASDRLGAEAVAEARAWRLGPILRDED